jgi:hypothetical protein
MVDGMKIMAHHAIRLSVMKKIHATVKNQIISKDGGMEERF